MNTDIGLLLIGAIVGFMLGIIVASSARKEPEQKLPPFPEFFPPPAIPLKPERPICPYARQLEQEQRNDKAS